MSFSVSKEFLDLTTLMITPVICTKNAINGNIKSVLLLMFEDATSNASGLFSMVRGGAGRLLTNIRDTVASYAKSDLDITYITSRLVGKLKLAVNFIVAW